MITVFIDTSSLLRKKTGIGYCVQNLIDRLCQYDEIKLLVSHDYDEVSVSRKIDIVSKCAKKIFGNCYPEKMAALVYNTIMLPFSNTSPLSRGCLYGVDKYLYHETSHNIIKNALDGCSAFIVDIHDLSPAIYPEWHLDSHVDKFNEMMNIYSCADAIIVKTNFIKKQLVDLYKINENIINVIGNGVGAKYIKENIPGSVIKYISKKLNIDIRKPFILFVGTIEPRKNLLTLIYAFCRIRKIFDVRLIIAGGLGWKYNNIVDAVGKYSINNDIVITDYLSEEELLALYNLAYLFVYPSFYEGFGMPPLEAMACGLPVIVSNNSSLPEVVGNAALQFFAPSVDDLCYKINMILGDGALRADLINKGFERVACFNWDSIVAKTVDIYKSLT